MPGMKDRHAVTRQWLSVPGEVTPEQATLFATPELTVLDGVPAREQAQDWPPARQSLRGRVDRRGERRRGGRAANPVRGRDHERRPNRYGGSASARSRDNAAVGLALLRGERRERDRKRRGLDALGAAVGGLQPRARAAAARPDRSSQVSAGDVLQKCATGGSSPRPIPPSTSPGSTAGELATTGPLPGGREIEPPPETPARALEDQAIADVGATREDFARAGRDLPGARRPLLLRLTASADAISEDPGSSAESARVRLRFALPAGGYATVVIAALTEP